jgi:hypothetical protein
MHLARSYADGLKVAFASAPVLGLRPWNLSSSKSFLQALDRGLKRKLMRRLLPMLTALANFSTLLF